MSRSRSAWMVRASAKKCMPAWSRQYMPRSVMYARPWNRARSVCWPGRLSRTPRQPSRNPSLDGCLASICVTSAVGDRGAWVSECGPPSGQDCRLRRRPTSRRRVDAPPVSGLVVRRSMFVMSTSYGRGLRASLGVCPRFRMDGRPCRMAWRRPARRARCFARSDSVVRRAIRAPWRMNRACQAASGAESPQ